MTTKRVRLTETADLAAAADHFRLLDLPFDLREYVSQFVDRRTAARLLTVSSGFHELFARSVWRCINQRVFKSRVSNETRASALARYGRLVRRVDIRGVLDGLDYSIDLSQLLPNVTVYKFDVGNHGSSNVQALHLIQAVSGFHGLRPLKVILNTYSLQFCLEPLADALISRQQNQNWQCLRRFNLVFTRHVYKCPWADMADFVSNVTPLQIDDFDITIEGYASKYPTAEEMALIAPHLTSLSCFSASDDISPCRAHHNRIFYRSQYLSGNDGLVVFPHLKSLRIYLCCASSAVYDYADFTQAKFPRAEKLDITMFNCEQDTMSMDPDFVHPVLSQYWPCVSSMEIVGNVTSSILYAMLDPNPQVTDLDVETDYFELITAQINHFSLADIVKRLPLLDTLNIVLDVDEKFYGNCANDADRNEERGLLHINNSQLRSIQMNYLTLTSDCLEMLYMLPKLKDIKFSFCNLDNPEAVLENFERIKQLNSTMDSGKYGARVESIYFDNVGFERDGYWPIEIVIAIAAAAPNIKSIKFDDATPELLSTIREHLPNVDLPLGGL